MVDVQFRLCCSLLRIHKRTKSSVLHVNINSSCCMSAYKYAPTPTNIQQEIAERAMEYVHANEVILTAGHSHTTALFLRKAAEKRQFQVVVAEGAPAFQGLPMARQLAEAGIQATVITDAAVYVRMLDAQGMCGGVEFVWAYVGLWGGVYGGDCGDVHGGA